MSRKVSQKVLQEIQRGEQQSAGEEHGRRQPSASTRTVSIVSYAVLALVLLIAGLVWRAEVKAQAARKQQAAEQALAEQYRAWYERAARKWRWQNPQVAQRVPQTLPKTTKTTTFPVTECVSHYLGEGYQIADQSGVAFLDSNEFANEYATQQATRELGLTRGQLEEAERREAERQLDNLEKTGRIDRSW